MIPIETQYKTHDAELLAIVEAFKTWRHYLKGYKHKVLILTNHNNLRRFMNIKSLSSRQVRWAQKLSRYHFRIDYRQSGLIELLMFCRASLKVAIAKKKIYEMRIVKFSTAYSPH